VSRPEEPERAKAGFGTRGLVRHPSTNITQRFRVKSTHRLLKFFCGAIHIAESVGFWSHFIGSCLPINGNV